MDAVKLPNGNLLIPKRAEGPDGLIGDGTEEITPEDPQYQEWLPFIAEQDWKPNASQSNNPEVNVQRKEYGNCRNKYDERRRARRQG